MNDGVDRSPITPEELKAAREYALSIEWSDEDNVFIVSVPELPGVRTHGATREEAAAMGDELVAVVLSAMRDSGRPMPPPLTANNVDVKEPAAYDPMRIQKVRRQLNVSQQVFADMLNVSLGTVRSWEQGIRTPDGASLRLLSIVERHPQVLLENTALRRTA